MAKEKMEVTLHLQLYPEDFEYLRRKAVSGGLGFEELFETFAGDLACGDARSGSDECDLACEWYDRHGFDETADMDFVRFLTEWGYDMEEAFDALNAVDVNLDLLTDDLDGEQRDECMEEIRYSMFSLKGLYEDYCGETKGPHDYREELQALWKYGQDEARFCGNEEIQIVSENFWDRLYDLWEQTEKEAEET